MKFLKNLNKKRKIILALSITIIVLASSLAAIFFALRQENFISKLSKNKNEYEIHATIDCENKTVKVQQETKYINLSNTTLNNIKFHIYPKAFSAGVLNKPISNLNQEKAYPNGISYGSVEILSVQNNENPVEPKFENDDKDILVVDLESPLSPNQSTTIEFSYSLVLPNISHRYGYSNNTINLGNFYLIACVFDDESGFYSNSYHYNGDPFYSDIANYFVKVSFNKSYTIVGTGEKVCEEEYENLKTATFSAKAVRDFALILSKDFKKISATVGQTEVNYYYFSDKFSEKSLQTSKDSLETFNNLFGEYPYKTLNVCEADFVYGGMEYPNLVFISSSIDNYEDYTHTIIHEIAHQWWYGLVGNNEYKYGFLDESLTEYSVYLFFDHNPQYEIETDEMIKNLTNSYLLFIDVYKEVFSSVDTSMQRDLNEFKTEPEYTYMAYVKGTLMFDSLKNIVSEKVFLQCLKAYFNQNKGKNVTPTTLISCFNKICKKDLSGYFDSWITGKVVIEN